MKAPETTSKPRVICPRGSHLSRLVQIVDLGTQHFKPGDEGSRKLYFGFETCEQRHVFKDENGPEPFMLQVEFAFYMRSANPSKPTKLRSFVVQWFGKDFASEAEAQDFEFRKLLNRVAMLTVAHKPKQDGSQKAIIADIYTPDPPHAKTAPPAVNPIVCYEIDDREGGDFAKLPEFLQKKLRESDEFKKREDLRTNPTVTAPDVDSHYADALGAEVDPQEEDDIPF